MRANSRDCGIYIGSDSDLIRTSSTTIGGLGCLPGTAHAKISVYVRESASWKRGIALQITSRS